MAAIHRNEVQRRYEIEEGGRVAGFAQYVERPGRVIMVHTEIDSDFEGHGLATKLATFALDDIRSRGLHVVPLCPFIESYIERHPEYQDLVDQNALDALSKA